ncbi:hypothetical protein [Lelliottia sp. WAP21]|uniref:hypothetical protein n=1 Tax=Lelliottia sp. WAP21 TaxID=2877426 RepID=UPI001E63F1F3|nr:hypothetical protein [Lelliottia sp. WAP21]
MATITGGAEEGKRENEKGAEVGMASIIGELKRANVKMKRDLVWENVKVTCSGLHTHEKGPVEGTDYEKGSCNG